MHGSYGEVVRTKPNELSFISSTAWKDIYTIKHNGRQLQKFNLLEIPGVKSIINSGDEAHTRHRKVLSHAFSDKAVGLLSTIASNHF
jgi:cytochrome P450